MSVVLERLKIENFGGVVGEWTSSLLSSFAVLSSPSPESVAAALGCSRRRLVFHLLCPFYWTWGGVYWR